MLLLGVRTDGMYLNLWWERMTMVELWVTGKGMWQMAMGGKTKWNGPQTFHSFVTT